MAVVDDIALPTPLTQNAVCNNINVGRIRATKPGRSVLTMLALDTATSSRGRPRGVQRSGPPGDTIHCRARALILELIAHSGTRA